MLTDWLPLTALQVVDGGVYLLAVLEEPVPNFPSIDDQTSRVR